MSNGYQLKTPPRIDRPDIKMEALEFKAGKLQIDELDFVIRKLQNNKAPGPDTLKNELIKYMTRVRRNSKGSTQCYTKKRKTGRRTTEGLGSSNLQNRQPGRSRKL